MFERRLYHHLDWLLLGAMLTLCCVGVAMIYSTTGTTSPRLAWTQIYAMVIGVAAFMVCVSIDYRALTDKSHFIYLVLIALLLYVLLFGTVAGGARRWISLGAFNLQPSEFAKVGVALVLAKFFGENRRGAPTTGDLAIGGLLAAVPLVLIAREPDLGTAVTILPIFLGIAYVAGMRLRILGILAVVAIVAAPVAWNFALKDYQKGRIETFLDPSQDPKGAGYQQIQAQITVGSGGLWGKGFQKGTQGQLRFLPVAHNDFIFSVLAEEQGFAGVLAVLSLYLLVIWRALDAARLAKDRLGVYLVLGLLASFTFQVIYNITMSAGLAPVKGLTLPLMSYGGSSMIATLATFGLIQNVRMRRFTN
ncbi:MAG: rod shape-determining protein RodA [Vicinamibacterales bacterium]|nr:rod shape-determining protein RodA [Vicinamibacterales bacterium]